MSSAPKTRSATTATAALLLLAGGGLALFALLADWLGIGGGEGFGYQQMIVLIVGIVLMLSGLRLILGPWINRIGTRDTAES